MSPFDFDKTKYRISTGAALVLHGIKETTNDIDVGCDSDVAKELLDKGYPVHVYPEGYRKICFDESVDVFENWSPGETVIIDGQPVLTLDAIIEIKKALGREKDFADIALIEAYRNKGGEK